MTAPLAFLPPPFVEARPDTTRRAPVLAPPGRRTDWPVAALAVPGLAAGLYDAETTFDLLHRGGSEANPLMRPVVNAGRLPTYALMAGQALGTAALGKKLRDERKWYWWLPQSVAALGHLAVGLHNARTK